MNITSRKDVGTRSWSAFLAIAVAICLAFGALGIASGAAVAAPDDSKSTSVSTATTTASSSSSAASSSSSAADADKATADDASASEAAPVEGFALGDDLFIANDSATLNGLDVVSNLFVAGNNIDMNEFTVGADAFVAGETIKIAGLESNNNIFVAGNNITVSGTSAQSIAAAGNNLDIAVDAHDASLAGRTVFLKGTFEGDVHVSAQTVVVDPYIVVNGTLYVSAESEPTIASTAKIGKYEFSQGEYNEGISASSDFATIGSAEWIKNLIMMLISVLLIAIVMLIVLRTETVNATGKLVRNRPVAILVTGLLSLILLPVLIVAFLITIVGWPISLTLMAICTIATVLSVVYTAIALGRAAFPRINKWISTIIFVLVFGLLMSLPIVDFIVAVLCLVFTLGSFVQGWWVWRRGKSIGHDDEYIEEGDEVITVPRGSHTGQDPVSVPANAEYMPSGIPQAPKENVWPD